VHQLVNKKTLIISRCAVCMWKKNPFSVQYKRHIQDVIIRSLLVRDFENGTYLKSPTSSHFRAF
jgi:hypothetical protein